MRVLPPEHLQARHDVSSFRNGKHDVLDAWLRDRAAASEGFSARTYVICDADASERIVGYYAISTAMEERIALPTAKIRRSMPERMPLMLIGRLAVDVRFQGMGLGTDLLADALRRCLAASLIVAARAVITHAIDGQAVHFYQHHGFMASPLGERIMLMPMETVADAFELQVRPAGANDSV
jgi:GNAT superfamily N-acetyltransferase